MSALNNQERKLDRPSDSLLIKRLEQAEKNIEEQQKQLTKMLRDLAEVKTKLEMEVKSKQASEQSLEAKIVEAIKKLKEDNSSHPEDDEDELESLARKRCRSISVPLELSCPDELYWYRTKKSEFSKPCRMCTFDERIGLALSESSRNKNCVLIQGEIVKIASKGFVYRSFLNGF